MVCRTKNVQRGLSVRSQLYFRMEAHKVVRGTMEGIIGHEIAGENGFGYDPIFYLPECGCTSAELAPEEKNRRSHRGEGLRKMREILENKKK